MPAKTARRTWQKFEGRVAALFGARRQIMSGSAGVPGQTRSDSTHPRLFIECKLRESHAVRTLWEDTKALARKEGKTPLVALADKHKPGFILAFHSDDIEAIVLEYCAGHIPELKGRVRHQWLEVRPVDEAPEATPAAV